MSNLNMSLTLVDVKLVINTSKYNICFAKSDTKYQILKSSSKDLCNKTDKADNFEEGNLI